ncbi:MAG: hypothetical protein WC838_00920, partial [Candidatus Margulisiibacteriota bacterium]
ATKIVATIKETGEKITLAKRTDKIWAGTYYLGGSLTAGKHEISVNIDSETGLFPVISQKFESR